MNNRIHNSNTNNNIKLNTHGAVFNGNVSLKNGESIELGVLIKCIYDFSLKAASHLPISLQGKQRVASKIGLMGSNPIDKEFIKKTYRFGRQWIHNSQHAGELQTQIVNNKTLSFIIALDTNQPLHDFYYALYHEIDHMAGYLGYQYQLQQLGVHNLTLDHFHSRIWKLKTEFFARVNTANETMLDEQPWDYVYSQTGKQERSDDLIYGLSMKYATKFISARNGLFNLLVDKYGRDPRISNSNANIKQPGYSKFVKLCNIFAEYLFSQDSDQGFLDFIDRMDHIVETSNSIELAVHRISGGNNEMKIIWKNTDIGKTVWSRFCNGILDCY